MGQVRRERGRSTRIKAATLRPPTMLCYLCSMRCNLRSGILLTCVLCAFTAVARAQQGQPLPDDKGTVAEAQKKLAADPKSVKLILDLGRAQAGVWRMEDAIASFTQGLKLEPENISLLLERGHRYVSTRRWELAMKDLDQASRLVDQDAPEHYEIWYHIGVAQYLQGNFADSADAWDRCRTLAHTDDQRAGSGDWSYMVYRRLRRDREAAAILDRVSPAWKITGSPYYFQRLLFYKGLKKESEMLDEKAEPLTVATVSYGLGNWYLYNGNPAKAREYFEKAVASKGWAAWGYIASDIELKRMK
jgi:tetratricopeptide (TPR) repeat protein